MRTGPRRAVHRCRTSGTASSPRPPPSPVVCGRARKPPSCNDPSFCFFIESHTLEATKNLRDFKRQTCFNFLKLPGGRTFTFFQARGQKRSSQFALLHQPPPSCDRARASCRTSPMPPPPRARTVPLCFVSDARLRRRRRRGRLGRQCAPPQPAPLVVSPPPASKVRRPVARSFVPSHLCTFVPSFVRRKRGGA